MSAAIKIARQRGETPPPGFLRAGDSIEMSLSAEVMVGREKNFITYKVFSRVGEEESTDEAHTRAMSVLHDKFAELVNESVAVIRTLGD